MSFLAPLFLVGAVAIAGPIIFHLIRRTVKERVRFSTLMFLKESPPRLTKRSHLENLILLLMRCAVVCLLAVSFARPYFQRAANEPPKAASGRRIVVLLDTSASLRRAGLFDAAKRAAIAAVRNADANDSLAVMTFDSGPRTIFSFEQWQSTSLGERAATAISRIDATLPTWQSTHLGKALVSAAELLLDASRTDPEGGRSTIVVVSDLQQGAKLDGIQGFEWPRGLEVSLQPVGSAQMGNAGVQILAPVAGEGLSITNVSLRARVVNSPGAKNEQFKIGWAAANGNFIGGALDMHVPAGQNRSLGLPAVPTNNANLTVLLTGDAEPFDNRAYHAAPPRQTLRVTYIGKDDVDDPDHELFYVRRAFPETAALSVKVDTRQPAASKPVDGSLAIVTSLDTQDAPALKRHLQNGGMVLLVPGANADLAALTAIVDGPAPSVAEAPGAYVLLANVDFDHPIFTQFRDARFNDFTRIHFWKHRKIDLTALPKAKVVATFDDNSPALTEIAVGKGALYILASGWNTADSQFALSSKFLPFLYALLEQSAPITTQARQLTIGDSVPFPGDFNGESIVLTKPDGTSVQWKKGEAFAGADQPGFYSATEPKLLFAVNLDPAESRTAPIPEEQLASLGLPLKHDESPISAVEKKQREQLLLATEQEARQKLWRRLLVAALAILLVEAAVARLASTRPRSAEAV
jgi:hypothetical protein